ncbi:MAG: glycosyltransferase family 4 protein, partial [Chloroflexi bacterium]|nr:glycosyltransferase family 4 protein [Chloroflexota bacterium]
AQFREWGHEITILAPASDPEGAEGDCIVMGRPRAVPASGSMARISFTWKGRAIESLLGEGAFEVVHLHEPLMPLLPYQVLRHSQAVNVGTFHAAKEGGNRLYGYSRPLIRRWFRQLEGKIAVSPAAARLVGRYFPGYFNLIPNGIDFGHFAGEHEPLPEFDDDCFNLLFVGRPEKRKGLKYALRAFRRIREAEPRSRLIVVGAGSFRRYERIVGPDENVVFRSNVPYGELPRYHHSAHAFCSPATGNESQGIALLEAMAARLPVVASNIEGFAGVITNEVDGLLAPPKDDAAIADAVLRLRYDRDLREALAEQGQAQASHYSWENVARRVMAYYERLLYERGQVAEAQATQQELTRA